MLSARPADSPLELLREWLEEDRREGIPWTPEQFAHTVWLACRECRARGWVWPILSTYPAWRAAFLGKRGPGLSPELLYDSGSEHQADEVIG